MDSRGKQHGGASVERFLAVALIALACLLVSVAAIVLFGIATEKPDGGVTATKVRDSAEPESAPGSDVPVVDAFHMDWEALKGANPDVVGWIYIPGTPVNYPIVWRDEDEYYLEHDFDGNTLDVEGAEFGCPALSCENSPGWEDQLNFLSAHHMKDGSMFTTIAGFVDDETFNDNRTMYILTPSGGFKATSFACDKVRGDSDDILIPNFGSQDEFAAYLEARMAESLVSAEPPAPSPDSVEKAFAVYTCNEPDNRFRIVAYYNADEFVPAFVREGTAPGWTRDATLQPAYDEAAARMRR